MILQNYLNPEDEVAAHLLEVKKTFSTTVGCRNLGK